MNFLETWLKDTRVHQALRLSFAILITVILVQFKLDVAEFTSYDIRSQYSPKPKTSNQIVIIKIDAESLKTMQHEPDAKDWTVLFQHLQSLEPKKIVSLLDPTQIKGSPEELQILANTARLTPFVYGENDLPKAGQDRMEPLPKPFELLDVQPMPSTEDKRMLGRDSATRRMILQYENTQTLHMQLASLYNGKTEVAQYRGTFPVLESTQVLIRYRHKGAYKAYRFVDILDGSYDAKDFKDKIILIGNDSQEVSSNYVTTPLSKQLLALSLVEMHANAVDTLILNQQPVLTPEWLKFLITLLVSIVTMYIVLAVRPGRGLLMLGALVLGYCFLSLALFSAFGWVAPLAHPLVVIFICYYFVIPYRLIVENRKSWEYYQKNKLLTQVEELKSNFMRMMSHDLKTPLARIQGMTELIQKSDTPLNETQLRALDSISESSEELTEFIGSILSLSRIESKEVKLQLQSKDINQLVQQVIRKFDFQSKRKQIEVVTELEPMFSVKVDEDLIRQVLSNLMENAIKYSPEGSKVLVSTEEVDGQIVVQVADQGRGIAPDELPHIFTRFYRGKEVRSEFAGSGLGLYLTKYFVELHNGSVEVESELGKGSTFTVRIPMDLTLDHKPFEQGGAYA